MHQISLQNLAIKIPRKVINWSTDDICTWLSLNQIDIDHSKIRQQQINGANIKRLTPVNWIQQYGLSKFIARQIVEWLEDDAEQFDLIVQEVIDSKLDTVQNQAVNKLGYKYQQQVKIQDKYLKNNGSINTRDIVEQQLHSAQHHYFSNKMYMNQKQQKKQSQKQKQRNSKQISSSNQISSQFSRSNSNSNSNQNQNQHSSSVLSHNNQSDDQITSLKSQQKKSSLQDKCEKYEQLQMQRIHSQATERIQLNKIKNQVQVKSSKDLKQKQKQKQKQIYQNLSFNVGKWVVKKKQENNNNLHNLHNQKIKNKNKQINKNPKLYNYISSNVLQNIPTPAISKKNINSQQIPSLSRKPYEIRQTKQKSSIQDSYGLMPEPTIVNPYVKFVSSQFIPYLSPQRPQKSLKLYDKSLMIKSVGYQKIVTGYAKIGRLKQNDITLLDESVSRNHAQILPSIQMNGKIKYFLKDIGSKFGTFVECKVPQQNIQGKSFLIGDSQIQILTIQISKQINQSNNLTNRKLTFDIKVRIDRQKQLCLVNRNSVTIGKKTSNDIRIQNNCENAKIWIQKDRKIYLDVCQGKLYIKLKQYQPWDIQVHADMNRQVQVVFGWLKVCMQIVEICINCGRKSYQCFCSARQQINRPSVKN